MSGRRLSWEGLANVRDLGGLPAADGGTIARGALVRSGTANGLTARGWAALEAHGIRTVLDLRNDDELGPDHAPRPAALTTIQVALDAIEDTVFWDDWTSGPQFGTPLYYRPFLDRHPDRVAAAIRAIATARPGGVLVHCMGGRDRTGLVTILALALAGVAPEAIADDYALSTEREPPAADAADIEAWLAARGTTAHAEVRRVLDGLDVEAYVRAAGVRDDDLAALRARLIAPTGAT